MKENKLFNQIVAALAFSGIFVAGFPQIAFSSPSVNNVCKQDNSDNSKAYVFVSNNGQQIVVETNLDHDGVSRGHARKTLKDSHGFSDGDAQSVFNDLNHYTLSDILLCDASAANETVAEAEVNTPPSSITLTGTIRDFKESHPDFESTVGTDRNIVTLKLGDDKKPVYALHPNDRTKTTNGVDNFNQWYRDVEGVNKRKEHSIELTLQSDGTYKYQNNSFFPINGELWGNYRNNKNYHFTYEIHTQFTYQDNGEVFSFSGDDDVWVYINGERVIDIGGVHTTQSQSISLNTLNLTKGETYDLDFFFAERHYSQSNFTITTNIPLITTVLNDSDSDLDNNGILDRNEIDSDIDNDGFKNLVDLDDDGDNIADVYELYTLDQIKNTGTKEMTDRSTGQTVTLPNPPASYILPTDAINTDNSDNPDYQDTDTDNDQFLDSLEAGDTDLATPPVNSDNSISGDSIADFRDLDSDDNGILDQAEVKSDVDADNTLNFQDLDDDGDGIIDLIEIGSNAASPTNSDNDSTPDYHDTDSDDDNLLDSEEGVQNSANGTTKVSVYYPNSNGVATIYNLLDGELSDTQKDGLNCITENTVSTCDVTSTLSVDGKVTVTGTMTGLDYQVPAFAD